MIIKGNKRSGKDLKDYLTMKETDSLAIDVLKRGKTAEHDGVYITDYSCGWNACIDHLASIGLLRTPSAADKAKVEAAFSELDGLKMFAEHCLKYGEMRDVLRRIETIRECLQAMIGEKN